MKVKVREGFVVHHTKVVEVNINGAPQKQVQTNTYFPSEPFDLAVEDVEDHLHKLEPVDKEATKYFESRAVVVDVPAAPGAVDPQALAAAVAATLQAMGLVVAAPTAPAAPSV